MPALAAPPTAPSCPTDVARVARAHATELRRLARRLCRSPHDADDLVQDVMVKVLTHRDRLPANTNLPAWMTRVLYNLFVDRVRQRRRRPWLPLDEQLAPGPAAEAPAWWEELTTADVQAALVDVPAELRRTFELFALEQRSYADISRQLGVPGTTIGTRILRARRHLRTSLTRRHAAA